MTKKEVKRVTLPISDTMPGPGTFEAEIIIDKDDASQIPSIKTEDSPDYIGHGTADDVHAASLAPKPDNQE